MWLEAAVPDICMLFFMLFFMLSIVAKSKVLSFCSEAKLAAFFAAGRRSCIIITHVLLLH